MSSGSAARLAQSTTLGEGRSVAFPPPEPEIVQVATTPVPEPELTVEIGDRPTTGHLEKTVLYSVDDYYTVHPVTPSDRPRVVTIKQPFPLQPQVSLACFFEAIYSLGLLGRG